MNIKVENFGKTKENKEVLNYIIETSKMKLEILNYGCVIKSLSTPDRNGKFENIVLGFDNLADYDKEKTPFFGAVVGRIAGRTKDAILKINNIKYELEKNDGKNNLHGGTKSLHNRVWNSSHKILDDKIILKFNTTSPHMENGFPGEIKFEVNYVIEESSIELVYVGIPDRDTYMNLTNHVYFNLSGDFKEKIDDHEVKFNSKGYYKVNSETLPIKLVEESEIFNKNRSIYLSKSLTKNHEQIKIVGNGYDHPFLLSKENKEFDGYVFDEKSGRKVIFKTDQPVVVFYTGNYLEDITNYPKHGGLCLETQDFPDIGNLYPGKMKIYSPTELYTQKTKYIFE